MLLPPAIECIQNAGLTLNVFVQTLSSIDVEALCARVKMLQEQFQEGEDVGSPVSYRTRQRDDVLGTAEDLQVVSILSL